MKKELLELQFNQHIAIEKNEYEVIGMIKFEEGSSYWVEYMLKSIESNKQYFLDVEPAGKVALHEIITLQLPLEFTIYYKDDQFELFQKGNAKVVDFYGNVNVMNGDAVEYFEYIAERDENQLLTIEKWYRKTENSKGRYIKNKDIKVLK